MYLLDLFDILDIHGIYWIYCTYREHTSCKMNYLDKENANYGGGSVNIEILVANPIEKLRFLQKHDITGRPMRSFCP